MGPHGNMQMTLRGDKLRPQPAVFLILVDSGWEGPWLVKNENAFILAGITSYICQLGVGLLRSYQILKIESSFGD